MSSWYDKKRYYNTDILKNNLTVNAVKRNATLQLIYQDFYPKIKFVNKNIGKEIINNDMFKDDIKYSMVK